jgi:hypothetical protein
MAREITGAHGEKTLPVQVMDLGCERQLPFTAQIHYLNGPIF